MYVIMTRGITTSGKVVTHTYRPFEHRYQATHMVRKSRRECIEAYGQEIAQKIEYTTCKVLSSFLVH